MDDQNRLRAYLRLHLAEGVGAVLFSRLVEAFGDAQRAAAAGRGELRRVEGVGAKTAASIADVTDDRIDAELAEADEHGVSILTREDASYPPGLKGIYDPPPVLYVRGRLERTDAVAMGVVGARRCTYYGLEQSERFGQLLGRAGLTVVSGGARGIDAAAHRGSLLGGGRTLAVMGCGLARMYPPDNQKLFDQIVAEDRGAIVSELPMTTEVKGTNFPRRNRIISGLSLGVLIVEAARRSGSLITARLAAEQGRGVFALPGRVDSPLSQGANELIRDGAILVQDLDDILEHLDEVGRALGVEEFESPAPAAPPEGLSDREQKLLGVLADGGLTLDELVRRSGVSSGPAASAMTMLVLKGVVVQREGNVFHRKTRSTGRSGGA